MDDDAEKTNREKERKENRRKRKERIKKRKLILSINGLERGHKKKAGTVFFSSSRNQGRASSFTFSIHFGSRLEGKKIVF